MSLSVQERPLASHPSSYEPNLAEDCLPLTFTHHSEISLVSLYRNTKIPSFPLIVAVYWATCTLNLPYIVISNASLQISLLTYQGLLTVSRASLLGFFPLGVYCGNGKTVFLKAITSAHQSPFICCFTQISN